MRKRVYVAGPISLGDIYRNIRTAVEVGKVLMMSGFAPLVPHLNCFSDLTTNEPVSCPNEFTHEELYDSDLSWVSVSDAVLRLPGESVGADMETALAKQLGIPVFTNVPDLVRHFLEGRCDADSVTGPVPTRHKR